MGAAMVGMALHGGVLPVGGTFFVFADYMRPAIRLAALSKAKCVFVFSHDSVGVGEDGPTHQPIEHLASLRAIPGLQVIRPADANETAQAWMIAATHDGPTALILSRQNLPVVTDGQAVHQGAGIVKSHSQPVATLIATGSEVHIAVAASEELSAQGIAVDVVSMPSWERFRALSPAQREVIVNSSMPRISIEAGSTFGWSALADVNIGIDHFGASAPGNVVLEKFGMSVSNIVDVTKATLGK